MKASIHPRELIDGTMTNRVRWRQAEDGKAKRKTRSFGKPEAAERFRINVEKVGPDEALRLVSSRSQ